MIRSNWTRGILLGAPLVLGATCALAMEDSGTLLTDESSEYGPKYAQYMVARRDAAKTTVPPRLPGEVKPVNPIDGPSQTLSVPQLGNFSRVTGAGVVALASASPEVKVEQQLKTVASELR